MCVLRANTCVPVMYMPGVQSGYVRATGSVHEASEACSVMMNVLRAGNMWIRHVGQNGHTQIPVAQRRGHDDGNVQCSVYGGWRCW
jgi:hypothetical protein